MKKRIIGRIPAVGLAMAAALPFSACKGGDEPSATRDALSPPAAEEAILLTVPEEPLYFGNTRKTSGVLGYIVSGEELGAEKIIVTLPDNYFYYQCRVTPLTAIREGTTDGLELFMEYNGADWQGLYDLWYEEGEGAYREVIEKWQAVYEEVKDEMTALYGYRVEIVPIEEEFYQSITEDPEQALADRYISQADYDDYRAGRLRYYAPASDEEKDLTELDVDSGDGAERYSFGVWPAKDHFDERMEWDDTFVGKMNLDEIILGASVLGEQEWEGRDTVTINHMTCVHLETGGEREYGELTLKRYECPESQRHGLEIEKIEVRYISLLGVETAVEWDGNSDLTIPIWNYIEGDEDFCRFCIFVTLKGDFLKGSDFNLYLESFLTLGFENKVFSIHAVSSAYEPKMRGVRSQINEIYAEIVDGVDVGARERILGNTVMNRKSPAGHFMSNEYERSYKVTTWWQRYVSQMTRI